MNEILQSLFAYLKDNWPELLWIAVAAGGFSYLASRRARLRWQSREFLDRFNVSLTSIDQGLLRIRTIFEMDCEDIFLNPVASKNIVKLAKQTTAADSIIPIPEKDCWQYLNAVLNEVSERFAEGQLRRDNGLPVDTTTYLLCLTCERAGPIRTQKIRGLLTKKELLLNLPEEEPKYESPLHDTRWQTLKQISLSYQNHPHQFIEIEICL